MPSKLCNLVSICMCYVLLNIMLQPIITNVEATSSTTTITPRECSSIDIRTDCENLKKLEGCTIIKGFLKVVLIRNSLNNSKELCNSKKYSFPLREITDYLIFHDVDALTTLGHLFPNLTVIRGRRLFMNYALGISLMSDLKMLEFKSLIAIQRGHVFVGNCPKLCQLNKINWDRLTLSAGENHIYPMTSDNCTQKCVGCTPDYCWSRESCQKFENANLLNLKQGSHNCHKECLGGCYNSTNEGCLLCKGLKNDRACVSECPEDKFMMEHYQRCYTKEECFANGGYIYGFDCVEECPSDFKLSSNRECKKCDLGEDCTKICNSPVKHDVVTIYNLDDADYYKGCHIINSSMIVAIRNKVHDLHLINALGSIREIVGHLKIYRSPHITSLNFLHKLRRIQGVPLESERYAFVVYDNDNLREMWPQSNVEFETGGMFIHLNNKMCNRKLKEFRKKVRHESDSDSIQTSDADVLCSPSKLTLEIEVLSHHSLKLKWRKDQTSDEVEIIYREILKNDSRPPETELDSNVCSTIKWQRVFTFPNSLANSDETHYIYQLDNLQPNTKYGCLVKTFGANEKLDTRSELVIATTQINIPKPPIIIITNTTDNSISLKLKPHNSLINENIEYYLLDVYELTDELKLLDERDYCKNSVILNQAEFYTEQEYSEDYDDCCAHKEQQKVEQQFLTQMVEEFSCSLDKIRNCVQGSNQNIPTEKPLLSKRLESSNASIILRALERYQLYTLQARACNSLRCSSQTWRTERTNPSPLADNLEDLRACRMPASTEYHIEFTEPKQPNGAITSYVIHYQVYSDKSEDIIRETSCVTRRQHANANYLFIRHLNNSFDQVAVRVNSLSGHALSSWINVSICNKQAPTTKVAGFDTVPSHGINIFLIFFLIGAGGTVLWICYKRRMWRKIPKLKQFLPLNWRSFLSRPSGASMEDRQILVDGFETVRFHNHSDDEHKYLE